MSTSFAIFIFLRKSLLISAYLLELIRKLGNCFFFFKNIKNRFLCWSEPQLHIILSAKLLLLKTLPWMLIYMNWNSSVPATLNTVNSNSSIPADLHTLKFQCHLISITHIHPDLLIYINANSSVLANQYEPKLIHTRCWSTLTQIQPCQLLIYSRSNSSMPADLHKIKLIFASWSTWTQTHPCQLIYIISNLSLPADRHNF